MTTAQICSIRKRVGPHLVRSATTPPFGPQKPKEFAVSARCLPAARDAGRAISVAGPKSGSIYRRLGSASPRLRSATARATSPRRSPCDKCRVVSDDNAAEQPHQHDRIYQNDEDCDGDNADHHLAFARQREAEIVGGLAPACRAISVSRRNLNRVDMQTITTTSSLAKFGNCASSSPYHHITAVLFVRETVEAAKY